MPAPQLLSIQPMTVSWLRLSSIYHDSLKHIYVDAASTRSRSHPRSAPGCSLVPSPIPRVPFSRRSAPSAWQGGVAALGLAENRSAHLVSWLAPCQPVLLHWLWDCCRPAGN